jgi:hypothetical protein
MSWLRSWAGALAVLTLLVWGVRIRNAVGELGPTLLAITFVALAVAVLLTKAGRSATLALAGWTVLVWVVRIVDIALLSDHEAAFVVVHAVLAVASVSLAVLAARPLLAEGRRRAPA